MGGLCSPSATAPAVTVGTWHVLGQEVLERRELRVGGNPEGCRKSVCHALHMQWKSLCSLTLAEFWGVNLCVIITGLENKTKELFKFNFKIWKRSLSPP